MTDPMAGDAGPAARARYADGAGPAFAASSDVGQAQAERGLAPAARRRSGAGVARDLGVTAAELSAWRGAFLAAGVASLKIRPADGRDVEISRLKAGVGDPGHD